MSSTEQFLNKGASSGEDERPARASIASVGAEAARAFLENQPLQLAAALPYYTLLSIAPLLLVITGAAVLLLGEEAVRATLTEQARDLVGEEGASLTGTVLVNADRPGQGWISYGAAGSAIVFMVWVYYAALILFIGAEITRVLARRRSHPLVPARHARSVQTVRGSAGGGE